MKSKNKNKKLLTLAILVMALLGLSGSAASAGELLVYEPFDYPNPGADPNELVFVDGLTTNALGLTGTWSANFPDSFCRIEGNVLWGSLGYSTLSVEGRHYSGKVANDPEIEASLGSSVAAALPDGFWFSFISSPCGTVSGDRSNNIRFQVCDDDNSNNVCLYMSNITEIKARLETSITVGGIESTSAGEAQWDANWGGANRWAVAKVTFNDPNIVTVTGYLPGEDLELPDEPFGSITATLTQPDFTKLRIEIDNGNTRYADELKIGATFGSLGGVPIDPNRPSVDAGGNMASWSGGTVAMDPCVVNNDPCLPTLTYKWTAEPNTPAGGIASVVFDPSPDVLAPDVIIAKTAPTGSAIPVTMTLTVTRPGSTPNSKTMTIDVYDTGCDAQFITSMLEFGSCDIVPGVIVNSSFQTPVIPTTGPAAGQWEKQPTGATWTFSTHAGIATVRSDYGAWAENFFEKTEQHAFLQWWSSISQTLTGLTIGRSYAVSFYETYADRGEGPGSKLSVIIDEGLSTEVTIYHNPNVSEKLWTQRLTTRSFIATSTSHTLTFRTTNPLGGDRSTLINRVSLVSSYCLMNRYGEGIFEQSDANLDCVTNLKDAAALVETWLDDNFKSTGPAPKP